MKTPDRLRQIIAANIDHLIEQAEAPEEALDRLLRAMEEGVLQVRQETAKAVSAEKRLARQATDCEQAVAACRKRSEDAVRAGRDEEARRAVAAHLDVEEALAESQRGHADAAAVSEAMKGELDLLERKLQELRRKRDALLARKGSAEARRSALDTAEGLDGISREVEDLLDGPGRTVANAVEQSEAESEARQELRREPPGAAARAGAALRGDRVEAVLQEMKARLGKPEKP